MKKIFLASSFADVVDLFSEFTGGDLRGKTVTFIPTASLPEEIKFYVAAGREALESMGMIVDELEISTATSEEITAKLENNDAIYVTGGNTFYLLQELKRKGADRVITEQVESGKLYIGESAGSIILAESIEYVKTMDNPGHAPNLDSFSSLGIIDFYPVPHYTNPPFKATADQIIADYKSQIPLLPISNTQAILVNDDQVEVAGN